MPERVTDRLLTTGFVAGWTVVGRLPEAVALPLFTLAADLTWWRRGRGVRRLEANLTRAVGPVDEAALRALSRRAMRSYLRYWCDSFRLPGWSRERTVGSVRVVNEDVLRATLAGGRGMVGALAHQGNWDHAGAWSTFELAPVTTVAERLRPAAVFDRFVAFRERLGMEILPLTGSAGLLGTLARRLRAGGFVPLLCDRDLSANGVRVTLLGEPARMAAGPAVLALLTGAPLVPVSIYYERLPPGAVARWGVVLHIHPPVEVPPGRRSEQVAAMMQGCADALGEQIRAHPEDWHMLQAVFEADLVQRADRADRVDTAETTGRGH
jgi:phosphatidylinositol dimannoside acyltransferase